MGGATPATKVCSICHEELPIEEFYRDRGGRDGRKRYCRSCQKARKQMYAARKAAEEPDENPIVIARIPSEYALPANVLLAALKEASTVGKKGSTAKARRDALEWLLTYDVVEHDERGFSCGFCIAAAILAGIDFPSMDSFRDLVHRLAKRAGFQVVYVNLPESLSPHSGEDQPTEQKGILRNQRTTRRDKAPSGAVPVLIPVGVAA